MSKEEKKSREISEEKLREMVTMKENMTEKNKVVSNSDNEWLGPMWGCGFVDEVNGPGAEEIPSFTPTRHELIQLVMFWAETAIDLDYFAFLYESTGSTDIRLRPFASRRINRIVDILGKDEVSRAIDVARAEFKKKRNISDREWDIFLNGTSEQVEEIREEVRREIGTTKLNW